MSVFFFFFFDVYCWLRKIFRACLRFIIFSQICGACVLHLALLACWFIFHRLVYFRVIFFHGECAQNCLGDIVLRFLKIPGKWWKVPAVKKGAVIMLSLNAKRAVFSWLNCSLMKCFGPWLLDLLKKAQQLVKVSAELESLCLQETELIPAFQFSSTLWLSSWKSFLFSPPQRAWQARRPRAYSDTSTGVWWQKWPRRGAAVPSYRSEESCKEQHLVPLA